MNRLTERDTLGEALLNAELNEKYEALELIYVLLNRLAAYEDTGLEPGEIKSMQSEWYVNLNVLGSYREAEADGRLLVLPCRCQDCKFFPTGEVDEKERGFGLDWPCEYDNPCPCKCDDGWYSIKPSPDFYCACGKRKDEDDA